MIKRATAAALILILLAPLNMGAAASMALSASASATVTSAIDSAHGHMGGHDHGAMTDAAPPDGISSAHDHSVEDCDLCMNCSNHCSSTALAAAFKHHFKLDHGIDTTNTGATRNRVDILFRPPISA